MKHKDKRIIFFGRGLAGSRVLSNIVNSSLLKHIVGVVSYEKTGSYNNTDVIDIAKEFNIPLYTDDINHKSFELWVRDLSPDLGLVTQFSYKIPQCIVNLFHDYIINCHPSDLPIGRGGFPIHDAIIKNLPFVISIHKINDTFDAGDVVYKTDPIDIEGLTIEAVFELFAQRAVKACKYVLEMYFQNLIEFIPQNESNVTLSTYSVIKDCLKINWDKPGESLLKTLLANGRLGTKATFHFNKHAYTITIINAFFVRKVHSELTGLSVPCLNGVCKIFCLDGYLFIKSIAEETDYSLEILKKNLVYFS